MSIYRFKARDKEGVLHEGSMAAGRRESVADYISGKGFIPVLIKEEQQSALTADFLAGFTRVKPQDLIVFSRQLATLLSAGVPYIQSLNTMEKQTDNPRLRHTISVIRQDIENGLVFSRSKGQSESGVPLLSDIPLIGWFFKKKSKYDNQTELMIFMTPTIVKE